MRVQVSQQSERLLEVTARDVTVTVDRHATAASASHGFRSTELFLGSLGACMVGTMMEFARRQSIEIDSVRMTLEDEVTRHPTRIGRVAAVIEITGDVTPRQLESLERVAAKCKIHNTLESHPEVDFRLELFADPVTATEEQE